MIDVLLRDGYQVKTRWVINGASTLWQWANFFPSLEEAQKFKAVNQNRTDGSWKIEIEIFRIERLVSTDCQE